MAAKKPKNKKRKLKVVRKSSMDPGHEMTKAPGRYYGLNYGDKEIAALNVTNGSVWGYTGGGKAYKEFMLRLKKKKKK